MAAFGTGTTELADIGTMAGRHAVGTHALHPFHPSFHHAFAQGRSRTEPAGEAAMVAGAECLRALGPGHRTPWFAAVLSESGSRRVRAGGLAFGFGADLALLGVAWGGATFAGGLGGAGGGADGGHGRQEQQEGSHSEHYNIRRGEKLRAFPLRDLSGPAYNRYVQL